MEVSEENGSDVSLKRPRAPLSDSEDNGCSAPEANDGQKRRRLEAAGQENRCPEPSSSVRRAELETKPDTPIVPSVRSRVQQLTQRRDGGAPLAQRCLSDPGGDSRGFKEPLLGEAEFNQRMERFREPSFQSSPTQTLTPANPCPRTRSNFVSVIQQKLQGSTTPSSKQVSRIRQEREHELSQLPFQPITENAWLKRSSSDSSLAEERTPGPSCASYSLPRSNRRVQWPPTCPWDDRGDQGVADVKDGSFTESPTTSVQTPSLNMTAGQRGSSHSEAQEAYLETGGKQERRVPSEEPRQEQEVEASAGNEEEQPGSQQPEAQTVLKLSFSEDHSFSKVPFGEDQDLSELTAPNEQSFFESTRESNVKETVEDSTVSEQGSSDMLTFEEDEKMDSSCFSEGEMEPSTDEELRMWRYPQSVMSMEEESVVGKVQEVCVKEAEGESSQMDKSGSFTDKNEPTNMRDGDPPSGVSAEIAGCSETQEDEKPKAEDDKSEPESCLGISERDRSTLDRDKEGMESCDGRYEGLLTTDGDDLSIKQEHTAVEVCTRSDDAAEQSKDSQTVCIEEDHSRDPRGVKQAKAASFGDVTPAVSDGENEHEGLDRNAEDEAPPVVKSETALTGADAAQASAEIQASDQPETGQRLSLDTSMTEETRKAERGESSKKVTFILEPEFIYSSGVSDNNTSTETALSDAEVSFHDETNSGEMIEQMFEEVLEYAERMEDPEDHDSGIAACSVEKNTMETESEKEKSEEAEAKEGECDESDKLESIGDELLTFPPSGILSPLSKSVEAVVTPLRLAASQKPNPPLLLTPDGTNTPPADSAPLYSIDAYRTQRQNKLPTTQSVTPGVQRQAQQTSKPQPSVSIKEKITALNEEAGKLQTVINQTLQALSCCTDEEHGRGSLEEAEAEKLLLVSCEKRSALLAEVARLKEERSSESAEAAGEDREHVSQQPCRGTVSITNIQLPLKVEYVCSSHNRAGRPSHYFFVLIRYGPYNIVATPLATAADAQNGDTISFPTSVTLEDIRSSFEIDVEVYSLSQTSASNCSVERTSTKPRVTPRKLLNTLTRSSVSSTSAAPPLSSRRSSNFSLVGSHKITLASLGHSKFPLDKMKLDGKVKRLLGDEFQEKVPFLSPLEGNIYLQLESKSHSDIQHQGFLTMFELVSGYGVWHRRFFVLEGCSLHYWNYPNDRETKEAEGSVSLASSPSQYVRPVERASCARPFTFELVSSASQQEDDLSQEAVARCLFSADSKQERLDWMEKLNQALLDLRTWSQTQTESRQSNTSSSGNLRESIL